MPEYRFDEIAILRNEKRTPVPEDKYTYVGLEHLDSGKLEVTRWGSEVDIKGEKLVMHKGDILFGRRNTYLKRAAIAPHDGLFSAHGMIFRPNTKVISERLFPFFIASDYFMDAAIRISVGSLSPTVNWKTLRELKFKLPPLEQQNELADLMQAANDTKVAYEQLLRQIDELVKSQFIEMFGDPEFQKTGLTPLGDHIDIVNGFAFKGELFGTEGIPVIKIGNVNRSEFSAGSMQYYKYDESLKRFEVRPGDLLVSLTGTVGKEDFGNVCRASDDFEVYYLNQRNAKLLLHPELVPEYLMYLLRNEFVKKRLVQSGTGVRQCHLHNKDLNGIMFVLPAIEVQKKFAEFIQQSDKSKFELKQAIERVTNLMKSLMQQDFAN